MPAIMPTAVKFAFAFAVFAVLVALPFTCGKSTLHVERDDNLPARVPYVFPAPGTDKVR